jgi:hypothetical protein
MTSAKRVAISCVSAAKLNSKENTKSITTTTIIISFTNFLYLRSEISVALTFTIAPIVVNYYWI